MTEDTRSMSSLTAALYGALVVYLGGWFLGHWTGNFSLLLFMLTTVTLLYCLPNVSASARRVKPPLPHSNSKTPHAAPAWPRWA